MTSAAKPPSQRPSHLVLLAALAGMAAAFALGLSVGRRSIHASARASVLVEPPTVVASESSTSPAIPASAYAYCAACHRPDGQGIPGIFPPLAGSPRLLGDERIAIAIALHGFASPNDSNGSRWSGRMVGMPHLSDDEIASALTFARSAWGNQAAPVTSAAVAAVRKIIAGHTPPWTPETLADTFPPSH